MICSRILNLFKTLAKDKISLLVCIYTCQNHRHLLPQFYASKLGVFLQNLPSTRIIEIYANPDIERSLLRGNKLILCTEEKYENLSLKTYMMIAYIVTNFRFKHLIKVDVTSVVTGLNLPNDDAHKRIDENELMQLLISLEYYTDYRGFTLIKAGKEGAENWAARKGGIINYEKLFGDADMPDYFSGKFYVLSQRFAEYISKNGFSMAQEHVKYFMGSEDLMIGRLYEKFSNSNLY